MRRASPAAFAATAAALTAALVLGCDTPTPPNTPPGQPALGAMTVAFGTEIVEVEFGAADCTTRSDGVTLIELTSTRQLPEGSPRILIAKLRDDEVLEAHAFVPQMTLGDVDHEMVQLVMTDAVGAGECRVDRTDEGRTLVCNKTTVVGWLGAGSRPEPSFRVALACESGTED